MVVIASGVRAAAAKNLQTEVFDWESGGIHRKEELGLPVSSDLLFQGWCLGTRLLGLEEQVPGCVHDLGFHGVLGKLFLFPVGRGGGSQERADVSF